MGGHVLLKTGDAGCQKKGSHGHHPRVGRRVASEGAVILIIGANGGAAQGAEKERALISQRTKAGLAAAKARGTKLDRKSTRLNSSHFQVSRMPSSA